MHGIRKVLLGTTLVVGLALGGGAAQAADVMKSMAMPTASSTDWTGFYAGFNLGYGSGAASFGNGGAGFSELNLVAPGPALSGLFAGGQAGYNTRLDNIVAGVEGDVEWSNENGSADLIAGGGTFSDTLDWTGAATAHVGLAMNGFMPYVLGGVAFAGNTINLQGNGEDEDDFTAAGSGFHMGYTVGGGVAAQVTDNITGFVEARYANYGGAQYTVSIPDDDDNTLNTPVSVTNTTIRAGLNFHMN